MSDDPYMDYAMTENQAIVDEQRADRQREIAEDVAYEMARYGGEEE